MSYKPVGIDEDGNLPPRARAAIGRLTATANLRGFGANPDGSTPADAAWSAMVSEVPSGTKVILDGNFLFADTLRNNGKELHVEAYGATCTRTNVTGTFDEELAIFSGSYGAINPVSSLVTSPATSGGPATTTLNLASVAVDLAVGDYVKVVCDDVAPASRVGTARVGWPAVVTSVSGSTVTVIGAPYSGDSCTTNIRVARVTPITGSWRGGTLKRAEQFITPAVGGSMIWLRDMLAPQLADILIPLSSGAGYSLSGCFGADLDNLRTSLLRDTWSDTGTSGAVLAYHVLETNSIGTRLRNSRFSGGRHGFTTAQSQPAAGGDATNTVLRAFGVVEDAIVQNVRVEGTYVAAFDTHEASRGVTFDNCTAIGSGYAGFSLRGRDHLITNSKAVDCNVGVRIFDDALGGESYGHRMSEVLIDNPRLAGVVIDVHRFAQHPNYQQRQPLGVEALNAEKVLIRGAKHSAIDITNARVGDLGVRVIWDAAPTEGTAAGVVKATNSEVRSGSTIVSDHRLVSGGTSPALVYFPSPDDSSVVEVAAARVLGATAQVDRLVRSASSAATAVLPDVLLDQQPGNTADAIAAAGSVIDYRTLSGQADSARVGLTGSTSSLDILARSMRPTLTVQATITAARNLPNLPAGRVQGQLLIISNRPATGGTGQSTDDLTVVQGNGPRTYLIGGVSKVLAPGQSITLSWDVTIGRWCQVA